MPAEFVAGREGTGEAFRRDPMAEEEACSGHRKDCWGEKEFQAGENKHHERAPGKVPLGESLSVAVTTEKGAGVV